MLAMGLPVVANVGVGDVSEVLHETDGGIAVESFDRATYEAAISALANLSGASNERRENARGWFDLRTGIDAYDRIYRRLISSSRGA
jgi:glycosyltransferase involved in cell wall biosynthesis